MKVEDVRRWADVRPGYWFAPKLFGWGATPVTWQGWLATASFLAMAITIAWAAQRHGPQLLLLIVPLIAIFIAISIAKTDGTWRWRWGELDRR